MSVAINGTNGLTFSDGTSQNTGATGFGFKNRIINGAMVIDQRNAGASVSSSGAYPVDRWQSSDNISGSSFTAQRSSTAPTGFPYSTVISVVTGVTASSTQQANYSQWIEGFNVADFAWGTSGASAVTLSFWVRASVAGTYCATLTNNSLTYVSEYTISSANTWEYKSVTVPGPTSGTWNTTNGAAIKVWFDLGSSSSWTTTASAWQSGSYGRTSSQTNLIGTTGATFYITGVQLEKGSTATSFDYRPYGTELALCQRYYIQYGPYGSFGTMNRLGAGLVLTGTSAGINISGVPMRSSPTVSYTSGIQIADGSVVPSITSIAATSAINGNLTTEFVASGGGLTVGRAANIRFPSSTTDYVAFSSEL